MNGAQDLGGQMGFGPVLPEQDEPLFHAPWEARALALTLAAGACGLWGIDTSRHARESLPPALYLTLSYYEIWIAALEKLLVAHGMVTQAELSSGKSAEPPRLIPRRLEAGQVAAALAKGGPADRPAMQPARFCVGQAVRTRIINPQTHTRLPRYARGKRGVVAQVHGSFVFPDTAAHGAGENPQWLYTVAFSGRELWGEESDPTLVVSIDAFEPYLEPDSK